MDPRPSPDARADYLPADLRPPPKVADPFGRWLLAQVDRGDWVDDLAKAARVDRGFPKNGTVNDVRARLSQLGADGEAPAQLDDAELDWLSL